VHVAFRIAAYTGARRSEILRSRVEDPDFDAGTITIRKKKHERVLTGAEWDLFRLGLSTLWDDVEMSDDDEEPGTTGVAVFDNLRKPERLALLAHVARGLHDEREPCSDLTALSEGTVAAVFAQLRYLVANEMENEAECMGSSSPSEDRGPSPRLLVLAAVREASPDRELPSPDSDNMSEWDALLDSLLDRILEDRDYLAGSLFLDADPSRSRSLKAVLGIPHGYFAAIRPDLTPEELERSRTDLRRICGRPWAWGCTTVCALEDAYHGLLIGPCDEAISDQEEGACWLVFKIFVTRDEGLDCTHEDWVRLFRGTVQETAALDENGDVTESCELAEAEQAAQADAAISLEEGRLIERRDEGWVIIAPPASFLFEVERIAWSSDEPLVFDTPTGALAAFLRAREHEEGRKTRYREAMSRLGRPLQGPSRYEEEASLAN